MTKTLKAFELNDLARTCFNEGELLRIIGTPEARSLELQLRALRKQIENDIKACFADDIKILNWLGV